MKMLWRIILLLITYQQMSLAIPITMINNALFYPINVTYWLANLSNIESRDVCICQCYANSNCITVNYYGRYQECTLFSIPVEKEQLRLMTTSENTTVISFQNRTSVGVATTTNSSNTFTTTGTIATTTYNTTSALTPFGNDLCTPSTSLFHSYTTTPTSYQLQTYLYIPSSIAISIATLEFGFKAKNSSKTWHLDDVSVVYIIAPNSELLVNGGFENGSLIGWQVLCSSVNCGASGGVLVSSLSSLCHTGSYCYKGACQGNYDYLRQSFRITFGHIYNISFWLYTDGDNQQAAYSIIREEVPAG